MTILQGIHIFDASHGHLECFRLDSGEFLLRCLPKAIYREIWGTTQFTMNGAQIRWRRTPAMDGAQMVKQETVTLEVWGVPFGLRSSTHMTSLVRGFGSLLSMPENGLQQGDLNVMRIEVAVSRDTTVPLRAVHRHSSR